jgi:hypothetical protein
MLVSYRRRQSYVLTTTAHIHILSEVLVKACSLQEVIHFIRRYKSFQLRYKWRRVEADFRMGRRTDIRQAYIHTEERHTACLRGGLCVNGCNFF